MYLHGVVLDAAEGNFTFRRFLRNCEKRLLASYCLFVHLPVREEKLGSHWTYFHEILYI
jgi:hypothetical protein